MVSIELLLSSYIFWASVTFCGVFNAAALRRPPVLPLARAAASPAWVRSRMRLRSNSARAPKM
jgi:hypothetical protein